MTHAKLVIESCSDNPFRLDTYNDLLASTEPFRECLESYVPIHVISGIKGPEFPEDRLERIDFLTRRFGFQPDEMATFQGNLFHFHIDRVLKICV